MGIIENLLFLTPAKGFCAAEKGLFSTTDSGRTWTLASSGNGAVNDIFFYDERLGYYLGDGGTGYSIDGGSMWNSRPITTPFRLPHRIFFSTPANGYVTSENGLFKTSDSGRAWKQVQAGLIGPGLYFTDSLRGWFTAVASVIYKTPDGCITFPVNKPAVSTTPPDYFTTIQFADVQHAWVNNTANTYIFRTVDGGFSWQKTEIGSLSYELHFTDSRVGYIAAGSSLLKSADGGQTWKPVLEVTGNGSIKETFFLNEKPAGRRMSATAFSTAPFPDTMIMKKNPCGRQGFKQL